MKLIENDFLHLKVKAPTRAVIFAAGAGGNPERHLGLLNALCENGCEVVAPYFARIVSPNPSIDELQERIGKMQRALAELSKTQLPIIGVGHSIGATLLLGFSGGQIWMRAGEPLQITREYKIQKLVMMTPPTGYFQAPRALDHVQIPIQAWAGALDTITPPSQIEFLKKSLKNPSETHVIEGAGHFTFMNTLPPNMVDPMKDRESFLLDLQKKVCRFILEP